jgi:hypothetical protein
MADALDPPQPDLDPPRAAAPEPSSSPGNTNSEMPDRRARVEGVEDDDEAGGFRRWIEDYPRPAGAPGFTAKTYFEKLQEEQRHKGQDPWAPFENEEEWGLAQWLMLNVGQNATDKFLKLPIVSNQSINSESEN